MSCLEKRPTTEGRASQGGYGYDSDVNSTITDCLVKNPVNFLFLANNCGRALPPTQHSYNSTFFCATFLRERLLRQRATKRKILARTIVAQLLSELKDCSISSGTAAGQRDSGTAAGQRDSGTAGQRKQKNAAQLSATLCQSKKWGGLNHQPDN